MGYGEPRQIECLLCGTARIVFGRRKEDMGVCLSCGYRGWTYSDELDGTTKRLILANRAARAPEAEPAPRSRAASLPERPRDVAAPGSELAGG